MLNKQERRILGLIETQLEHCKECRPNLYNIYMKEIKRQVDKLRELNQK